MVILLHACCWTEAKTVLTLLHIRGIAAKHLMMLSYTPFLDFFLSLFLSHTHSPTLWNAGRSLSAVGIIIIIGRLHAHWKFATRLWPCLSTGLWAGPWPRLWLWPWAAGLGDGVHLGGVSGHTVSGTTSQRTARVVWATDHTAKKT